PRWNASDVEVVHITPSLTTGVICGSPTVPPAKIHFGTSFLMLAALIWSSGLKRQPAYVRLYMSQLPASRSAFSRRASLTSAPRPGEGNARRSDERTRRATRERLAVLTIWIASVDL